MTEKSLAAFRLGDVRGLYPGEVDESFARRFGRAFKERFGLAGQVATGRDVRDSSIPLQQALNAGLLEAGVDVLDLGLCPTELGYFASSRPGIDAAIVVTASHNPVRYNGFKCVLRNGEAVTFDAGLADVMELMMAGGRLPAATPGNARAHDLLPDYLDHFRRCFSAETLATGPVAINGLNGAAATLADAVSREFELPVTWFRKEPGDIPSGGPDPANPVLAAEMKQFMAGGNFVLGVAWDGDCDRCVFFDGDGNLLPTYYIVGLLAEHYLRANPGGAVVFDTKLCWNTLEIIAENHGKAVPSQTGHAFMKRSMRESRAIYGGELSSHHFFGEFFHCDSGMFAWLKVLEVMNRSAREIHDLIRQRRERICCIKEINLKLADPEAAFREVLDRYRSQAVTVDHFDGLSIEMPRDWRFSLTPSKTEDVVRLNMESRAGPEILLNEGKKLLGCLGPFQDNSGNATGELAIQ